MIFGQLTICHALIENLYCLCIIPNSCWVLYLSLILTQFTSTGVILIKADFKHSGYCF